LLARTNGHQLRRPTLTPVLPPQAMKAEAEKEVEWRQKGHGQYTEVRVLVAGSAFAGLR
jgi:hypothetical protein